jgi:cysteine-S-conjugate beta-lyase
MSRKYSLKTELSHVGRPGKRTHGFVNPPVHRGSTVLYPDMATRDSMLGKLFQRNPTYGLETNPTTFALEDMVAAIEGGTRAQIVPTGLAAITVPLLAFLRAGDHVLFPDSLYGAARGFADRRLPGHGVALGYYPPCASVDEIEALIQPNTRVLYLESPGSYTLEVQDVPALCALARRRGLVTMIDNTWGIHAFQPFAHGVDISIQALTKYVVGHSDVMLGAVIAADDAHWRIFRRYALDLGMYASPDDCWLALRGGRTMLLRLERQLESALEICRFLQTRPEVVEVRFPPLPGSVGHELWKRDFTGGASLFGVVFDPKFSRAQVYAMVDALELFGIGASWGGYESLALPAGNNLKRDFGSTFPPGELVRFHIGLEGVPDLIADLAQAMDAHLR